MRRFLLIRLDDACPQMDKKKWQFVEDILDKYGIKPLVGIIPNNEDSQTCIDSIDTFFADKARRWQEKGWTIALHGYNHVCGSTNAGINPLWNRSEFAGLPLVEQRVKIRDGYAILKSWGLNPTYFFAPSHTYDLNTLKAIEEETPIRLLSDTVSIRPYKQGAFTVVPCQMGRFRKIPLCGYWTFCFHPNIMNEGAFIEFENFIKINREYFIGFDEIDIRNVGRKPVIDRLLSWVYFTMRKLRHR